MQLTEHLLNSISEGALADPLLFTKMQGIGNDFVVVDGRDISGLDWSALSPELCDRYRGVGADGLLVVENSNLAEIMMRMYNPDGTPDVCGNGLRCIARYAFDRQIVTSDSVRIATLAGVREARAVRSADGTIEAIRVAMGFPRFDPASVPVRIPESEAYDYRLTLGVDSFLTISALSTGSTHAVTFVRQLPDDAEFNAVSPLVEHSPKFPERTSLMWCKVESRSRLELRIWERGAGETLGCGTGACAAAVTAIRHGFVDSTSPVTVASKGGEMQIVWRPGEQMEMIGPAEFVFEGVYNLSGNNC